MAELPSRNPIPTCSIERRVFMLALAGSAFAVLPRGAVRADDATPMDVVQSALKEFQQSGDLSDANFSFREFQENFPLLSLERAPSRTEPSTLQISTTARKLIVAFEVSSESIYSAKYRNPIWPGLRSGVTIGIGYDLGYVSQQEMVGSWEKFFRDEPSQLELLKVACGVTGTAAQDLMPKVSKVDVSWDDANAQFNVEIQRYVTLTQRALPNFAQLPEDSRGALVSLVYNRGPSFDVPTSSDPSGRYQEMRNIRQLMVGKKFADIPNEIRAMARLWPNVRGLTRRREAEAALFQQGLQK